MPRPHCIPSAGPCQHLRTAAGRAPLDLARDAAKRWREGAVRKRAATRTWHRVVLLLARRTAIEDRMLQRDLEGYAQYTQRTRAGLLPGLWWPASERGRRRYFPLDGSPGPQ
jgi:hypothetical protein